MEDNNFNFKQGIVLGIWIGVLLMGIFLTITTNITKISKQDLRLIAPGILQQIEESY